MNIYLIAMTPQMIYTHCFDAGKTNEIIIVAEEESDAFNFCISKGLIEKKEKHFFEIKKIGQAEKEYFSTQILMYTEISE